MEKYTPEYKMHRKGYIEIMDALLSAEITQQEANERMCKLGKQVDALAFKSKRIEVK